jgi:hypothetical protein
VVLAYVASAAAAVGFLTTAILVPLAHGATGLVVLVRGEPAARAAGRDAVFGSLWVGVVALVLFGLPLPQAWHYARTDAVRDHLPLGLPLLESAARYLAGTSHLAGALFLLALAAWGWTTEANDQRFALAFTAPAAAALAWMLLPGSLLSARFLCFLVPTTVLGLALAAVRLARQRGLPRATLALAGAVWLTITIQGQFRWETVGNPDLKGLARRLDGKAVALAGSQADVNGHYFPRAVQVRPSDLLDLPAVDYVVQGRVGAAQSDERIGAAGFSCIERLESAVPDRTVYFVYRRNQLEARRDR